MLSRFLPIFRFSTPKIAQKKYVEPFNRSRTIMDIYNLTPVSEGEIFIAPNATIVGEVFMGHQIAIWHGTVLRGDINRIILHNNISIGNNCVLHTAASSPTGLTAELELKGNNVIQNNCTLYSCVLETDVYIGHNSVILEGAVIRSGAIIAPNSVVPPGRVVEQRQIWAGNPIKYVRKSREQQQFVISDFAREDNRLYEQYKAAFLYYKNAYLYRHGQEEPIDKHLYVDQAIRRQMETAYDPSMSTINRN